MRTIAVSEIEGRSRRCFKEIEAASVSLASAKDSATQSPLFKRD